MKLREKYRCPNNELFITALTLLIIFLAAELMFRMYSLYKIFPLVDVISHLLSGMAMAVGIYWILSLTKVKRKAFMAIVYTFFAGIIWEMLEMLEEVFVVNPPHLVDYFWWDGFFDVLFTVLGGIIALNIFWVLNKKRLI